MRWLLDKAIILPQYILPQHFLTGLVFKVTRFRNKAFKNFLINLFIQAYKVNMKQAIANDANDYESFNDFFTRKLKPDARNWQSNEAAILSPIDGAISQIGTISDDSIFQAKGKEFSLAQLLAQDEQLSSHFKAGLFATLYLSPRDYHRIHMPLTGKLKQTIYVPGRLFAVNNPAARTVDSLFARNERFISLFETEIGMMAQIMVGALFVGSMETVWAGQITPTQHRQLTSTDCSGDNISLQQGDEFGHFNMGSTVILLFERQRIKWRDVFQAGSKVKVGDILADR